MNTRFCTALLAVILLLTGCTPGEGAVQTAIAQTQQAGPTATRLKPTLTIIPTKTRLPTFTPGPTKTPRPTGTKKPPPSATPTSAPIGPDDGLARNYLGEFDSGGVKIEVLRVLVAKKSVLRDLDFSSEAFSGKDVVGEVIFRVTNSTDKVINLYVDQGILAVNSEQVDLTDYMIEGAFGDDLGGEFLPGAIVTGGIWFGLTKTEVADVTRMIIKVHRPTDSNFNRLGPDFFIDLDLSEHVWEALPEDF